MPLSARYRRAASARYTRAASAQCSATQHTMQCQSAHDARVLHPSTTLPHMAANTGSSLPKQCTYTVYTPHTYTEIYTPYCYSPTTDTALNTVYVHCEHREWLWPALRPSSAPSCQMPLHSWYTWVPQPLPANAGRAPFGQSFYLFM